MKPTDYTVCPSHTCEMRVRLNVSCVSQIAKQQQQLIQQQHKINLLQQQIQVSPRDLSHVTVQKVCVPAKWGNELVCKVHLSCLVPAGEHALRDDPGFPSQHPAPPGHLWPPDDSAAAADPVQARLVTKLAERLQTRLLPLQYIWINTQYILTIRVLYRIRIERRGSKEVTLLPDIQTQSRTASQNRDSRGVTAGISRGHLFPIFLSHYRFSSQNKCWIRKWGSYFSALCAHPYRCSPVSCPVTHNWQ